MSDEITYQFANLDDATFKVQEATIVSSNIPLDMWLLSMP